MPSNRRCKWNEGTSAGQWPEELFLQKIGQDQLADVWDHILEEIVSSLVSDDIRWSNIDLVSFGLGGHWAPIILWVGVPSGTLSRNGFQIAQSCMTVLRKNDVNHVDCEIGEVDRFHILGARSGMIWPESPKFFGTADVEAFSTAIFGKSKFTKNSSYPRDPKGFYAARNEKIFALTCPHIHSAWNAEDEQPQIAAEFIRQQRHLVTLSKIAILRPLREVAKPGYYNAKFAGNSDEANIEFFDGQNDDFEEEGFAPNHSALRSVKNNFVRFEKLIKMLNSWSTPETRIAGRPEFWPWGQLYVDHGDYTVGWRLEEVCPTGL